MTDGWVCTVCGGTIGDNKALVSHYKKEHPEGAWQLYDQIGDVGDKFANAGFADAMRFRSEAMRATQAAIDLEKMRRRHDKLAAALNAIHYTIELTSDNP